MIDQEWDVDLSDMIKTHENMLKLLYEEVGNSERAALEKTTRAIQQTIAYIVKQFDDMFGRYKINNEKEEKVKMSVDLFKIAGRRFIPIGSGETLRDAVVEAVDEGYLQLREEVDSVDEAVKHVQTAHSDYFIKKGENDE